MLPPRRLLLAATVLVALGAACAGTGYSYVKSSEDRTYFKVPEAWKIYEEDAVLAGSGLSPRERESVRDTSWQVGFDAHPHPSVEHLLDPKAKHPTGIASVEELSFDTADNVSLNSLRNYYLDIDGAVQAGTGEVIAYEPLEPDGGFRGFHLVADVALESGTVTLDQTTLLDQATSKMYTLLVACESQCYADNSDQIDRVVESWTVED